MILEEKEKCFSCVSTSFAFPAVKKYLLFQIISHVTCGIETELARSMQFQQNKMHEFWRFLTYMFVHENWTHLLTNIVIQLYFAYISEKIFGKTNILIIYLFAGICSVGIVSLVLFAFGQSNNIIFGASTAVYTLMVLTFLERLMVVCCNNAFFLKLLLFLFQDFKRMISSNLEIIRSKGFSFLLPLLFTMGICLAQICCYLELAPYIFGHNNGSLLLHLLGGFNGIIVWLLFFRDNLLKELRTWIWKSCRRYFGFYTIFRVRLDIY